MDILESIWTFFVKNLHFLLIAVWILWCIAVVLAIILSALNKFCKRYLIRFAQKCRSNFPGGELRAVFGISSNRLKDVLSRCLEDLHKDIERMALDVEARAILEKCRKLIQKKLTNLDATYIEINTKLLEVYRTLDNFEGIFQTGALATARETVKRGETVVTEVLLKQALRLDSKWAGEASYQLGLLAECRFNYFHASHYYLKAAKLQPSNLSYLTTASEFAYFLCEYQEAEALLRTALRVQQQVLGPEHPKVAQTLNNLGALCHSQGKYAEAEALYLWALEIYEPTSPKHSGLARLAENYAALLRELNRAIEISSLKARVALIKAKHPVLAGSAKETMKPGGLGLVARAKAALGEKSLRDRMLPRTLAN